MVVVLYDLVGADDRRFSPFCWRTRMALAHKRLRTEARPTRFTNIKDIPGGRGRVPVIEDGGRTVADSWEIAEYLEASYPQAPSLFGAEAGHALSRFVKDWVETVLQPAIVTLVVADLYQRVAPEDRDYFRRSREQRFGKPLEDVQAGRESRVEELRRALTPLRQTLREQPFLGGEAPLFADYMVFGALQWSRVASPFKLLQDDDPIGAWFERCLDLHGGIGRAMPAAA
jgi:glutathione S-transferase